jgi:hypothetical protein
VPKVIQPLPEPEDPPIVPGGPGFWLRGRMRGEPA